MKEILRKIDYRLYERCLTLEKNIKSASNSFYDSYLDLLEQFLRIAAEREGIEISSGNSTGSVLKNSELRDFLISRVGVSEYTYSKMQDYTLMVNEHKHRREKHIELETVLKYVTVICDVIYDYADFKFIEHNAFEAQSYAKMFGLYERENKTLRLEKDKYQNELYEALENGKLKDSDIRALEQMSSYSQLELLSLEEQNSELQKQIIILKDIKHSVITAELEKILKGQERAEEKSNEILDAINEANKKSRGASEIESSLERHNRGFILSNFIKRSEHEYVWLGSQDEFKQDKKVTIIVLFVSILLMGIATAVSTLSFELYTTFTFFENIWLFLSLYMLKFVLKAKKNHPTSVFAKNSFEIFKENEKGILVIDKHKMKYIVFFVVALINFVLNIANAFISEINHVPALVIIFEVLAMGFCVYAYIKVHDFFLFYGFVKLTGTNEEQTKKVVLYLDPQTEVLYSEEKFFEKYPLFKKGL